jgi:hypothetical protein
MADFFSSSRLAGRQLLRFLFYKTWASFRSKRMDNKFYFVRFRGRKKNGSISSSTIAART